MWGDKAAEKMLGMLELGQRVLDIGGGEHSEFKTLCGQRGIDCEVYDVINGDNWERGGYWPGYVDGVWCSHVLEHFFNPHDALVRMHDISKPESVIAITVPPYKPDLVGGHLSLFTPGLLLYRMIVAGFDCRDASVLKYGYNISVVMRYKRIETMPKLVYDTPDLETLAPYFPVKVRHGMNGNSINNVHWGNEK